MIGAPPNSLIMSNPFDPARDRTAGGSVFIGSSNPLKHPRISAEQWQAIGAPSIFGPGVPLDGSSGGADNAPQSASYLDKLRDYATGKFFEDMPSIGDIGRTLVNPIGSVLDGVGLGKYNVFGNIFGHTGDDKNPESIPIVAYTKRVFLMLLAIVIIAIGLWMLKGPVITLAKEAVT